MNHSDFTFPRLEEPPLRSAPHAPPFGATWGWPDLVFAVIGVLVGLFVLSLVVVGPFLLAYDEDAVETRFAEAVAQGLWYVVVVVTVYLLARRKAASWSGLGLRPIERSLMRGGPATRWALIRAVVVTFLGAIGAVWAYSLVITLAGFDFLEPSRQIESENYESAAVLAALGVSVIGGAPFAEELLFRGFIFAGLRRYMGFGLAASLGGGLFALAHQDIGLVIPFTIVAVVFAYSYERTHSLFPAIGGHLLFNLLSFSILVLVPEAR